MFETKKTKPRLALVGQMEYFQVFFESALDDFFECKAKHGRFNTGIEYYDDLVEFRPDVTVFFRGELYPKKLIEKLPGIKVSMSTEPMPTHKGNDLDYTLDSLARFKVFLETFDRQFDYVFHYDAASESFHRSQGVRLSGYWPLPVATNVYAPPAEPKKNPKYDILFFGRSTEHRERLFGPLKRDVHFLHIAHGIANRELLPYIYDSRICLNVHAENETSWEPRLQLMLATGSLVVSEPISENSYLLPNEHFVEARSPEGLYKTCREILANPDAYKTVAQAGLARVEEKLSAAKEWPIFIENILAGRPLKPAFDQGLLNLTPLRLVKTFNGFTHLLEETIS